jgi:hypothetical protein
MNDKARLLQLVDETPEWSPAAAGAAAEAGAVPGVVVATAEPTAKKRGRPRKEQADTAEGDTDTSSPVAVRGEGRGGKRLLKILKSMADEITLYYDSYTESYISFADGVIEHLCVNKSLQERFALLYYKETGETLGADGFASAVLVLAAQAKQTGQHIELFTRAGWHDGKIYYDLKNRRSLCIAAGGWSLVERPPVFFRSFSAQQAHPDPLPGGDCWKLFDYSNVADENRLLLMVWLIAAFVPGNPHPALLVSGAEGSGKSSFCRLLKRIIDPSATELQEMPKKDDDFDLLLFKHYCLAMDNISSINAARADRLCSAITQAYIEKRKLHTDTDTIILPCNPRIILNGINSLTSRTDLLDRSVTIHLERIPPTSRKLESELDAAFTADLPGILGGIADVLSKAVQFYHSVTLKSFPRMADFTRFGFAVAEALGGRGADFLKAYGANSAKLGESLLENNTFMAGMVQLMDDKTTFKGTFKEVVDTLAVLVQPDRNDYSFPSAHNLRKHLERLRPSLEARGIRFEFGKHTNKGHTVEFTKTTPPPTWAATAASGLQPDCPGDDLVFDEQELEQ